MDAVHIRVTALTAEASRALSALEKDQFPYALAKTLTEIASMAVRAVQARTRQAFKLHGEFIPRGIARTPAKKGDVKRLGIGTTIVYTKPLISGWMPVHEIGGVRTPEAKSGGQDKGRSLAIPARDVKSKSYRISVGRVRKRWQPVTLLQGYSARRNTSYAGMIKTGRGGRKGKAFITRTQGSDTPMIVRRKGKGRYPLELLYLFSARAVYKRSWDFEKTVADVVERRFADRLRRNLAVAVAHSQ